MAFTSLLYSFFLMPLQLVFEVVFSFAYWITNGQPGFSIIVLSLAFNLLVFPLYRRADAIQEEERNIEARLHDGVAHIKKTFRGDERTMMLQTYYRQNHYSPLYVLRSALSLFLQIPFFIAAYRFLSGLTLLQGVSFGPIADLSRPDALLSIGGFTINVLPIIMTAVNVISTILFTKGYPLKTKIQLYAIAAFFLIFLYNSPSGLVFYWTLNNVFSLVKTIFYKAKNPKKALGNFLLVAGICFVAFGIYDYISNASVEKLIVFLLIGIILCVPFLVSVFRKKASASSEKAKAKTEPKADPKIFWICSAFLTVLTGILIPSAVVSASPQEFVVIGSSLHPVWYVFNSLFIAAGAFILWMGVFYWLFSPKTKVIMERVMIAACAVFAVDYLFFGNNFGTLSSELVYVNEFGFNVGQILLNLGVLAAVVIVMLLITKWKAGISKGIVLAASVAMVCMSVINIVGIYGDITMEEIEELADTQPHLSLSKSEKNVVVFMLDRGMGEYIPYILSEYPDLEQKFTGFTYYSNTVSFGGHTNFGAPGLFGGYEYSPVEMNKRADESLVSKHNESLKVLPVLFDQSGYDVTVCDPPYAGYRAIPDISIYDDYPDIKAYITAGTVSSGNNTTDTINSRCRSFFCFSLMKSMPVGIQTAMYDDGKYNRQEQEEEAVVDDSVFGNNHEVMKSLPNITTIKSGDEGCFLMINNEMTHTINSFDDEFYQELGYDCNRTKSDSSLTVDGVTLDLSQGNQKGSFETNVAALTYLGKWFDYLKKEGVYDNTRIIVAADHGFALDQISNFILDDTAYDKGIDLRLGDAEFYYPLLMVKDFDSKGFSTSDEFMTNADVPTIATDGLFDSPTNPFTGKIINNSEKTAHDQLVIALDDFSIGSNNGNQFLPSRWYSIHDDIWKKENWKIAAEDKVLTSY